MVAARHFEGTQVSGTVQVVESAINDVLARSLPNSPSIALQPGNQVLVRYGMLHANVALPPTLECGPQPRLTLTLASLVVAWTIRTMSPLPFVQVRGRDVIIELAAIPALQPWREFLPHIRAARLSTERGALQIHLVIDVRST